jgi:predicted nuclease with TOPRIM domain
MTQNEIVLAAFEGRVRQLILRFQELKKENEELYRMVDKNEADIKALQEKLSRSEQDYNALKMARMVEITDGDLQGAKDRLSKLIREVNKCITILSDENKK